MDAGPSATIGQVAADAAVRVLMASPLLLVGALLAFLARSPKAATPLL
jgi:hypothetical protein